MAKRLIDLHIVQDAANLFNVADALGLEYVSSYEPIREHYKEVFCKPLGLKPPFYVDTDTNLGVAAALEHIRNTVKTCYIYADNDGFVDKGILTNMLANDRGIPEHLDEKDAFVFDRMVTAFHSQVIGEFQGCHGDCQYENRMLHYERNWPEFGNHWWDDNGYKFAKYDDEED